MTATSRRPVLTPANLHTLKELRKWIARHGQAPTLQELGGACGVSIGAARFQVAALRKKGLIVVVPGKARSIEILKVPA